MGKDGAQEKIEFHKKGNVAMKYLSDLSDIPEFSSAAIDSGQIVIPRPIIDNPQFNDLKSTLIVKDYPTSGNNRSTQQSIQKVI